MIHKEEKQDVRKICILYLLYTINMPMSNSQLIDFATETEMMDFFSVRDYLVDMRDTGLLEEFRSNNQTYYSITEEGESTLRLFKASRLSEKDANIINYYISSHKQKIKTEAEVTANYFYDPDSSFLVKCGVYEGNATLMEVNLSVTDRDLAEHICRKWKANTSEIYKMIFDELSEDFSSRSIKKAE